MEDGFRTRRGQRYQSKQTLCSSEVDGKVAGGAFDNEGFAGRDSRVLQMNLMQPPAPPRVARQGASMPGVWRASSRAPLNTAYRYQLTRPERNINKPSVFEGDTLSLALRRLVSALLSILTLGLYTPWGMCALWRWEADNTVISGCSERFTGTGEGLFTRWLLWTLPIYGMILAVAMVALFAPGALVPVYAAAAPFALAYPFWLRVNLLRWRTERTFITK